MGLGSGQHFAITVVTPSGAKTYQFLIKRVTLVVLAVLLSLGLALYAVGLLVLGDLLRRARKVEALESENVQLRLELARLREIEGRLDELERTKAALLRLAGVEPALEDSMEAQDRGPLGAGLTTHYRPVQPGPAPAAPELEEIRRYIRRVPLVGPLTRGFGEVKDAGVFHTGVDIAGKTGARVHAAGDGVVSLVAFDRTFGLIVVVAHTPQLRTMYGHNSKVLVKIGDSVAAGEEIAEVGSTGVSSAPHLHFEIQWKGKAVDPLLVLEGLAPVVEG